MYQQDELGSIGYKEQNKKQINIAILQPIKTFAPPKNQFKLSNNSHRYSEEATLNLEKMKNIAHLLMENKLTAIFHIIQLKLLNRLHIAFGQIATASEPHLQTYTVKEEIQLLVDTFVSKLNAVCKKRTYNHTFLFLSNLSLMFGKGKNENSKRQVLRINSKIDRQADQIDYFDKNITNEGTKSTQKVNKMLKKQKEQKDKDFINFKQQMDQLLSYHENYLNKKS